MPSVLITGANRGLGLEFTKQYAELGYRVFASARAPEEARALTALAQKHERISVHALDVSSDESPRALAKQLAKQPIDILLNNAGFWGGDEQRFGKINYESALETFNINALGPLRVAEAFLEQVAASERKLMVAVTSGMGSIGDSSGGSYSYRASKAALNMSFHNLGLDLKSRGIIAVVINPGWVQTDMGGKQAPTTVEDSIAAMRRVFDRLTLSDAGSFQNYKGGTIEW